LPLILLFFRSSYIFFISLLSLALTPSLFFPVSSELSTGFVLTVSGSSTPSRIIFKLKYEEVRRQSWTKSKYTLNEGWYRQRFLLVWSE
jgi:hypothetical protein